MSVINQRRPDLIILQTIMVGDTNAKIEEEGDSIGGKMQKDMVKRLNMTIMNETDTCQGRWTRIQGENKSRLDYVIACETSVKWMQIDEEKIWTPSRIKKENGVARQIYSDHTSIIMECNLAMGESHHQTSWTSRNGQN